LSHPAPDQADKQALPATEPRPIAIFLEAPQHAFSVTFSGFVKPHMYSLLSAPFDHLFYRCIKIRNKENTVSSVTLDDKSIQSSATEFPELPYNGQFHMIV
ncbi:MAG: hypothetical protein MI702_09250, partial [Chlorobiales bacterium]|nr:hypothetical protein [Chlorobiales bacterium]